MCTYIHKYRYDAFNKNYVTCIRNFDLTCEFDLNKSVAFVELYEYGIYQV